MLYKIIKCYYDKNQKKNNFFIQVINNEQLTTYLTVLVNEEHGWIKLYGIGIPMNI